MSQPKFASITSELLARKGEARPWTEPVKQPLAWRADMPAPMPLLAEPQPAEPRADWKKCTVRMSHHDYERLGILAVKQGKTRQRLLQETVDQLFTGMSQNFGVSCPCLGEERSAVGGRNGPVDHFERRTPGA